MISDAVAEGLAVLVHEVRSPVAALSAIAETFADSSLDRDARHELERLAIAACRGIERIVLGATITSVRLERLEVGDIVGQAVSAAALRCARIESRIAEDIPPIEGDPLRLRQALDNLVSNALTHAGSDGAVVVSADSSTTAVLLSVTDTGAGIPLAEQRRIFEKGVRLDEAASGSGLGLAIARAIAEAHGGTLTVTSAPGHGATFTIAIPRRG
jgi:signal transduction histidine kinase